jgi:two-component system, NtrC family, sensor histidine kinase KinB
MNLRTKFSLGLGFLFLLIVLLTGLGIFYLNYVGIASKNLLKDNYRTIGYMSEVLEALENIQLFQEAQFNQTRADLKEAILSSPQFEANLKIIQQNLQLQKSNITEIGEAELTRSLSDNFSDYLQAIKKVKTEGNFSPNFYLTSLAPTHAVMIGKIHDILNLNMAAIVRKDQDLQATIAQVITSLLFIGLVCIIISLIFIYGFPKYITYPLKKLTRSISQISQHNYQERLDFQSNDEFGQLASSFNRMAEQLYEYENSQLAKILFEKKRTEAVINKMNDAIVGLDENKIILFANPLAISLLGIAEEKLIGKYAPDVAATNDLMRSLIQELMTGFAEWEKTEYQALKIFADEKESYFSKEIIDINIHPTGEERNILIGHVIILKNITSFKELDVAKTNFMATISHELKTPISAIKMSLKLLDDTRVGELNSEQSHLLHNIQEDSDRLLKITGELLNLAQVETGNIQLRLQNTPPDTIINYALGAVKHFTEQKNITIEVLSEANLPNVQADPEKTAWVLINFLSNALRYSPENGKVILQIKKENKHLNFSVQDFGVGVPEQYQSKIFERYFQIPESGKANTGTGLGLAISKDFIEAQNGKIGVNSTQGEGSVFYFNLPSAS